MDIFFVGFLRHSVINILSTVTTYSICGNLLYAGHTTFSAGVVLAPLVAKRLY
jgi:hypothetical protein